MKYVLINILPNNNTISAQCFKNAFNLRNYKINFNDSSILFIFIIIKNVTISHHEEYFNSGREIPSVQCSKKVKLLNRCVLHYY